MQQFTMQEEIIQIQNLSKVYDKSQPALKNISLSVKKGSIFGIIGESGAGKSTLLRCLNGLEKPTSGAIFIDGKTPIVARKSMGMIFQHFNLFSFRTALQNILYPLEILHVDKEKAKRRALELIQLVGLSGKEHQYPSTLSGGEKQRVAIARALACEPLLLFSDEATNALDPPTKKTILTLLSDLNKTMGLTIVLITHEMDVIKQICTDVAVMERGEIVEVGNVEDLFVAAKNETTRKFLHSHQQDEMPLSFFKRNEEVFWLYFKGKGAGEPIISRMAKNLSIEINILRGNIDALKSTQVGRLLLSIKGNKEERLKAQKFLREQGVIFEKVPHE